MRNLFLAVLTLGLMACTSPDAKEAHEGEAVLSLVPDLVTTPPSAEDFERLLAEYRQMNDRLDRVSAPLRLSNAKLCKETFRDPGFRTHTLEDYPEQLRGVAQTLLGLEADAIYIRSVRRHSPADAADIQAGDRILRLNGQAVPSGPTMNAFYAALSRGAFSGIKTRLTLRTPQSQEYDTSLRSETACDYPTRVFYSQAINGHTDGHEVFITSELMRAVPDDVNLALIVAHEMAHAMAGHLDETPTQALELEADRMALVLMEQAGYDIDAAISYWADAAHPHRGLQDNSVSHPTITARYENFRQEQARITQVKRADDILDFY